MLPGDKCRCILKALSSAGKKARGQNVQDRNACRSRLGTDAIFGEGEGASKASASAVSTVSTGTTRHRPRRPQPTRAKTLTLTSYTATADVAFPGSGRPQSPDVRSDGGGSKHTELPPGCWVLSSPPIDSTRCSRKLLAIIPSWALGRACAATPKQRPEHARVTGNYSRQHMPRWPVSCFSAQRAEDSTRVLACRDQFSRGKKLRS